MNLPLTPTSAPTAVKTDSSQAAQNLGNLLREAPEYEAFLTALKALNSDLAIQKLSAEIRNHQIALQWGRDVDGKHTAELVRLELEMENLPAIKEYHKAEKEISHMLQLVDKIISEEAGLDFAANAQRTGCACGR